MHFFSRNLRYLRKKNREKQSDIAPRVNKKQNTVGNWENGISEPNIRELMILSQYFDVGLEELLSVDLEKADQLKPGNASNRETAAKQHKYPMNEGPGTMANEASQDQFWVLIRELRSIHEKLDSINALVESKSDKNKDQKMD